MSAENSINPQNGQWNLLVIAVQDLTSSEPVLENLWLLISFPRNQTLTLLPILPDPSGVISTAHFVLRDTFSLSNQKDPAASFFDQLHQEFWWDNYILVDEVGISQILDIIHPMGVGNKGVNLESIQSTWENPTEALLRQAELFSTICDQFNNFTQSGKIEILIQKMDDYIQSDLDWNEFMTNWSTYRTKGKQFECEFPTLVLEKNEVVK